MSRPSIESLMDRLARGDAGPGLESWLKLYTWEANHAPWEEPPGVKDRELLSLIAIVRRAPDYAGMLDLELAARIQEDPMLPWSVAWSLHSAGGAPVETPPGRRKRRQDFPLTLNQVVRQVLKAAVLLESRSGAFKLRGRGHEPRLSLDARLAQVVRRAGLPVVHLHGRQGCNYYPLRMLQTGERLLEELLGFSPIHCNKWGCRMVAPAGPTWWQSVPSHRPSVPGGALSTSPTQE